MSVENECTFITIYELIKPLLRDNLTVPSLPKWDLTLTFDSDEQKTREFEVSHQKQSVLADSPIVKVKIKYGKRLTTNHDEVKKVLELTLKFKDEKIQYEPGDSFGIFTSNYPEEVTALLERLGLINCSKTQCEISFPITKAKSLSHLPNQSTLQQILSDHVEIRAVPKKVLLFVLSCYTSDSGEKTCLRFLSSSEGSDYYLKFIRIPELCLLEVLQLFVTCKPPIEKILGLLPPLRPRFYSVANSPLVTRDSFKIVFVVVNNKLGSCHRRKGLCSGQLDEKSKKICSAETDQEFGIETKLQEMTLMQSVGFPELYLYKRVNKLFRLPNNALIPLILVGPGTGIAPFLGFLQHREIERNNHSYKQFGEVWLFYSCRYKEKDFLYREELEHLHSANIINHFNVCFSRDDPMNVNVSRYVQDNIRKHSIAITAAVESDAVIYVCGDAKDMARNVREAFLDAVQQAKKMTNDDVKDFFTKMDKEHRYIVDTWA